MSSDRAGTHCRSSHLRLHRYIQTVRYRDIGCIAQIVWLRAFAHSKLSWKPGLPRSQNRLLPRVSMSQVRWNVCINQRGHLPDGDPGAERIVLSSCALAAATGENRHSTIVALVVLPPLRLARVILCRDPHWWHARLASAHLRIPEVAPVIRRARTRASVAIAREDGLLRHADDCRR